MYLACDQVIKGLLVNHLKVRSFLKAAESVTFDLLIFEVKFLFFKNTKKKPQIHVKILPFS